jgi:hypothetical protein
MNKDAMNQGVQILLERMDTNPEEFEDDFALGGGKWYDIVQAVHVRKDKNEKTLPFLSDAEVNALYEKLEDVRRENFTATVLRRLADTPQEITQQGLWDKPSYSSSNYPVLGTPPSLTTGTGTGTWGGSSITTTQALNLSEREKEQIADAIDEIKHKRHQDLHKAYALAVKAEAVKAERKKAVK